MISLVSTLSGMKDKFVQFLYGIIADDHTCLRHTLKASAQKHIQCFMASSRRVRCFPDLVSPHIFTLHNMSQQYIFTSLASSGQFGVSYSHIYLHHCVLLAQDIKCQYVFRFPSSRMNVFIPNLMHVYIYNVIRHIYLQNKCTEHIQIKSTNHIKTFLRSFFV